MELEELQDQNVRQAYNLELVDDIDDTGTESDHEQEDELSPTLLEPEDDNLSPPHTLSLSLPCVICTIICKFDAFFQVRKKRHFRASKVQQKDPA